MAEEPESPTPKPPHEGTRPKERLGHETSGDKAKGDERRQEETRQEEEGGLGLEGRDSGRPNAPPRHTGPHTLARPLRGLGRHIEWSPEGVVTCVSLLL